MIRRITSARNTINELTEDDEDMALMNLSVLRHKPALYQYVHLFINLFIYSFIYSFMHLFKYWFIHLFIYLFIYSFIYWFIYLFNHLINLNFKFAIYVPLMLSFILLLFYFILLWSYLSVICLYLSFCATTVSFPLVPEILSKHDEMEVKPTNSWFMLNMCYLFILH